MECYTEASICENLSSQGVTSVKRIKVRGNKELVPTNTLILTFITRTLPNSVKAGYLRTPVVAYISNSASNVKSLGTNKIHVED